MVRRKRHRPPLHSCLPHCYTAPSAVGHDDCAHFTCKLTEESLEPQQSLAVLETVLNSRLLHAPYAGCRLRDQLCTLGCDLLQWRGRRYTVYKDHITLEDYEVHDGMGLELYYN